MSTADAAEKSAVNGIRTALGIGGVLAVIVGILILVWPGKTAMVVAAIIAIYAIAAGLVYAGLGIFSKNKGGWVRVDGVVVEDPALNRRETLLGIVRDEELAPRV